MHFGEYELSPSLISLSPPPSGHPEAFQRLLVRSSRWCYPSFNLPKGRSLGFASTASDLGITPSSDGSVIRLVIPALTEETRRELAKEVKKVGEKPSDLPLSRLKDG